MKKWLTRHPASVVSAVVVAASVYTAWLVAKSFGTAFSILDVIGMAACFATAGLLMAGLLVLVIGDLKHNAPEEDKGRARSRSSNVVPLNKTEQAE